MFKKISYLLFCTLLLTSCNWASFTNNEEDKPKDSTLVGADKDEHGCIGSAGYTWSKICNECIRAFTGIQLNPVEKVDNEDATLCAYLIFNEKRTQAELFLPDVQGSEVINQTSENNWKSSKYDLLLSNEEFSLKINNKLVYKGEAQIGNKIINSDEPEAGSEE